MSFAMCPCSLLNYRLILQPQIQLGVEGRGGVCDSTLSVHMYALITKLYEDCYCVCEWSYCGFDFVAATESAMGNAAAGHG